MKYRFVLFATMIILAISLIGCSTAKSNEEPIVDSNIKTNETKALDEEQTDQLTEKSNTSDAPYIFEDENALLDMIESKTQNSIEEIDGLNGFFRPAYIPSDISLDYIMVKDAYVALHYKYNDSAKQSANQDEDYLFEWDRTLQEGELEEDIYRIYSAENVKTLKHYFIINADALQDVFWEQNGYVFHAVTPSRISLEQLEQFCDAAKVTPN